MTRVSQLRDRRPQHLPLGGERLARVEVVAGEIVHREAVALAVLHRDRDAELAVDDRARHVAAHLARRLSWRTAPTGCRSSRRATAGRW